MDIKTSLYSGRTLYVSAKVNGTDIRLDNVYGPNEDDPDFYVKLFKGTEEFATDNIILARDFNLVSDANVDKKGGKARTNEKAKVVVLQYMENLDLIDIWRVKNPTCKQFTWRQRRPHMIQYRLNFFLVSQNLCNRVDECKIGTSYISDHSTVHFSFKEDDIKRGPSYWKFTCLAVKDLKYIESIKQVINECEIKHQAIRDDKVLYWEMMKCDICCATIKYASRKKKQRVQQLESRIKELDSHKLDGIEMGELEDCKLELDNIKAYRTKGNIVQSKAREYEEAEKSTNN